MAAAEKHDRSFFVKYQPHRSRLATTRARRGAMLKADALDSSSKL
jgi:hypothetical protein